MYVPILIIISVCNSRSPVIPGFPPSFDSGENLSKTVENGENQDHTTPAFGREEEIISDTLVLHILRCDSTWREANDHGPPIFPYFDWL